MPVGPYNTTRSVSGGRKRKSTKRKSTKRKLTKRHAGDLVEREAYAANYGGELQGCGIVRRRRKASGVSAGRKRKAGTMTAGRKRKCKHCGHGMPVANMSAGRKRRARGVAGGELIGGRKKRVVHHRRGGTNPWIAHIKRYAREHGLSYGDAMHAARASYRG